MRKKVFRLLLMLISVVQLGCAGIKLTEDRKDFSQTRHVEDYSYTIYIPYFRYVPTPVDIDQYCKGKEWKDLYVSGTALGSLVSIFTLGVVHPQKLEATCTN